MRRRRRRRTAAAATCWIRRRAPISAHARTRSCSTSTSPIAPRAPTIRNGPARSRRRPTASLQRSKRGSGIMDSALQVIVEMTESTWQRLRQALEDITAEEARWRLLPEANSVALIVRHLAIEAQWHRASLERGEPMPHDTTEDLQRAIDAVPLDFQDNMKSLEQDLAAFLSALKTSTLAVLEQRTRAA